MTVGSCLIIAEAGVNHNGSIDRALALVEAGAAAGVDVVKFQTFRSELLVTGAARKADYQVRQTGDGQTQAEMLKALELSGGDFRALADKCRAHAIEFMSTPFDEPSVDFLVNVLGVSRLKVSSGDLTNGPLLLAMARSGVSIILSTGMATLQEIDEALGVVAYGYLNGNQPSRAAFAEARTSAEGSAVLGSKVTILHCTSEYPTPLEDVNLRSMDTLRERYGLATGYSDHTVGITVPIAAAARGAVVLEKHFTLDRNLPGPDHAASLEPAELKAMVEGIHNVVRALGSDAKVPTAAELGVAQVARRSLHTRNPIRRGEIFTEDNIVSRRPAAGLSPMLIWDVLGTTALRDYGSEEALD